VSEGEDATEGKREVDGTIAQELKHQEDSYTEQIASLDIENTKISNIEGQETFREQEKMVPEEEI